MAISRARLSLEGTEALKVGFVGEKYRRWGWRKVKNVALVPLRTLYHILALLAHSYILVLWCLLEL